MRHLGSQMTHSITDNRKITLSAAAAIGYLSWLPIRNELWLALATAYSGLICAIFSLILAAQHDAILDSQEQLRPADSLTSHSVHRFLKLIVQERVMDKEKSQHRFPPNINKLYTYQAPPPYTDGLVVDSSPLERHSWTC